MVFADNALYVGMRMRESHGDSVVAQRSRRDGAAATSDWASVMIDSYLDRRTAFKFSTTPYGVRHDVLLSEDIRADTTWDAVWEVATSTDDEGWTAEFRIPLSQLRFSATSSGTQTVWGLQFMRESAHRREVSFWAPSLPSDGRFVAAFGELRGPDALIPPRRVEFVPYTVGRLAQVPGVAANPFYEARATSASFGADAKLGLTPNMTLTATLNPDFGQVEADPSVVNLGAFENFFPERRPFFTEGAEIFRFSLVPEGSVFYSRRIGRPPQRNPSAPAGGFVDRPETAQINGALKLSGKTASGLSLGLIAAVTERAAARFSDSLGTRWSEPVEPRTTFLVGRVLQDFRRGQSGLGAIVTSTERDLDDPLLQGLRRSALASGVNWWHRFAQNRWEITGWVLGTQVRGSAQAITATQRNAVHRYQRLDAPHLELDSSRTALHGTAGEFFLRKIGGAHWVGQTGGGWRTPGVDVNDGGFQTFADVQYLYSRLSYREFNPGRHLRNWSVTSDWIPFVRTYGNELTRASGSLLGAVQFRNFWNASLFVERWGDADSPDALRGGPLVLVPGYTIGELKLSTDRRRARTAEYSARVEYAEESARRLATIATTFAALPAPQFTISVAPTVSWNRDPAQYIRTVTTGSTRYLVGALEQQTAALIIRTSYALSADLAIDLYLQPFLSAGRYATIKEVTAPRADVFDDRYTAYTAGQIALDPATNQYRVDANQDAVVDFSFPNPDFSIRELRSNLVLRWEFNPGSTLFVVWSEARDDRSLERGLDLGRDTGRLFDAPARDVFLVKVSYWLGR